MGRMPNTRGKAFLRTNPRLRKHVVTVAHLSDPGRKGGPYGTALETKRRVAMSVGFNDVLWKILERALMYGIVIAQCNHGHHRSVALAEIAAGMMEGLPKESFDSPVKLEVIHVDIDITHSQLSSLENYKDSDAIIQSRRQA